MRILIVLILRVYFFIFIILKFISNNKNDFLNKINNNNEPNLNSEIKKLKEELNNKNKIIEEQNYTIRNLQNELNNIKKNLQILQNNLNQKEQELEQLKLELNKSSNKYKTGFAINFISKNQEILYPIVCNEQNLISRLEEELYNEYPKYKDYNTYLTCNGIVLKRFKTIGENNIKKGDAILVNIYNESNL